VQGYIPGKEASITMSTGVDYIRVRLIQCEPDDHLKTSDELFDPYVIVHVLEAEIEPGQTRWFCLWHKIFSRRIN